MTLTETVAVDTETTGGGPSVAGRIAEAFRPLIGELPVRLVAWDGSAAGPTQAPVVELRSPVALRRLLWHPNELGLAQAYVTGEIELPGEVGATLAHAWSTAADRGLSTRSITTHPVASAKALRTIAEIGGVGRPVAAPRSQARLTGRLHSLRRDRSAIGFHYDLSNDFYELILDPSMAYSCGYWTQDGDGYGLADAQRDKLDLICRKLGLREGDRLLDVGCGWGSLSLHAAERYGARVTAITLAEEQRRFIADRIDERGLADRVDVRRRDYRELPAREEGSFDAVASIEMGEHVGEGNYATYARTLHRAVRPGGLVLVQQMSRSSRPGGGPFIESFIAPDMHMRPLPDTLRFFAEEGLEIRDVQALREHYVRTVDAWAVNLDRKADALTRLVGEEVVRVWRLYLAGGALAFRDGRMGVDQLLLMRPGPSAPALRARAV